MEFGIKRKNDIYRVEAVKLVERLRDIPEFVPIIEEGDEEAIFDGPEEVKFLKVDIIALPATYIVDIIKYTITANSK